MTTKKIENEFHALIDTYAIKGFNLHLEHYTAQEIDSRVSEGMSKYKISLDKEYGESLKTLKQHKAAAEELLNVCNVSCKEDLLLDRVDVAIDTNSLTFRNKDNLRLLRFIFRLLTAKDKDNKMITADEETGRITSFYKTGSDFKLSIYDKSLESNLRHPYLTRIEFRYTRYNKAYNDFDNAIDRTINRIDKMDKHLESIENITINRLKQIMREEKIEDTYKNFTDFIDRHYSLIFTDRILKDIYEYSELKGNYKTWLRNYRRKKSFKLYKKADILRIKKALLKALKDYNI